MDMNKNNLQWVGHCLEREYRRLTALRAGAGPVTSIPAEYEKLREVIGSILNHSRDVIGCDKSAYNTVNRLGILCSGLKAPRKSFPVRFTAYMYNEEIGRLAQQLESAFEIREIIRKVDRHIHIAIDDYHVFPWEDYVGAIAWLEWRKQNDGPLANDDIVLDHVQRTGDGRVAYIYGCIDNGRLKHCTLTSVFLRYQSIF